MRLSRFFNELSSTYAYEIEDLTYDSGGDDVLKGATLNTRKNGFIYFGCE